MYSTPCKRVDNGPTLTVRDHPGTYWASSQDEAEAELGLPLINGLTPPFHLQNGGSKYSPTVTVKPQRGDPDVPRHTHRHPMLGSTLCAANTEQQTRE